MNAETNVVVAEAPVAVVGANGTPPAPKAKKTRNKTVSAYNLLNAIITANSTKTADEIAKQLGMEPQSFSQRLYNVRQDFRFDLVTRKEFSDIYPKNEKGEIEVENVEVEATDKTPAYTATAVLKLPTFLDLKDGRHEGSGSGRQAGDALRDALRKLRASETAPEVVATVDEV